MGRPRKTAKVEAVAEAVKSVSGKRCTHCGADEKESETIKEGDLFNVMMCKSAECLGNTACHGRRWVRRND